MNKNRERYLERRAKTNSKNPPKLTARQPKKKDYMEQFNVMMVGSFFLSSLFILNTFYYLDLSTFQFFQFYFLFLGVSFIVPIKIYRKQLEMSIYEYLLFNIMAFAPVLICITFFVNDLYAHKHYVEKYNIISYEHSEVEMIYTLENNAYQDKIYLRTIGQKDRAEISGNSTLAIHFSDGLLGIRRIEKKELN